MVGASTCTGSNHFTKEVDHSKGGQPHQEQCNQPAQYSVSGKKQHYSVQMGEKRRKDQDIKKPKSQNIYIYIKIEDLPNMEKRHLPVSLTDR